MNKKNEKKLDDLLSKIIQENLDSIMAERFSRYSKYVIQQRALPDVRDGLKPVQRRILYSMQDLKLNHDKAFKKSARVVGDVIGKYHPHGDSSIYDAMVRLAQEWKMGHTLVEMHGNVGSIDDDPAAAMRYTEVRLTEISNYVIGDIFKNTIKFAPNFDDSEKEPTVMASVIPNILLNGASGIASGFATEMPPHNLNEILDAAIAKIKNPDIQQSKIFKIVKGPDFPTGGLIYGTSGISEAFERGKGRITLVSRYKTYSDNKNKYIEINEIPYGVVKSKLVHDIDVIVSSNEIAGLLEVKDQSDRNGISILITLEKDTNEEVIINFLLSKTQMQIYYNYNNVVIQNNSPKTLGLIQLLDAYLDHVKDVKYKTLLYDLTKYKARLEIVLGFIKVSEITDQVISVIRNSENSKQGVIDDLIKHFNFSENQARAIAELRLYRLSKTDKNAFLAEQSELEALIANCELLLNDQNEFNKFLIELFQTIKSKFGKPRKTSIIDQEYKASFSQVDLVKDEEIILGISKFGYLKRISKRVSESNDFITYGLKEDDKIIFYGSANTLDNFLLFSNFGNYAYLPVFKINESKWKDFGLHLSDFVDLAPGEEIVSAIRVTDFNLLNYVTLISKQGLGKRVLLKDFEVSRFNKTFTAIKLKDKDELVNAKLSNGFKDVLLITKNGNASLYSENDIQIYGTKSCGTKSCYMPPSDEISAFALVENSESIALLTKNSQIKRINVANITKVPKKNIGKPIFLQYKTKPYVVSDCEVVNSNTEIYITNEQGQITFERVGNYPLTTINEGFSKIKIPNVRTCSFKINYISDNSTKPEISFTQSTQKEEELITKAESQIRTADLDIDDILKRVNIMFEKDKK
ncbi:DNA topoisomerase IV subunit A [Mycoplasma tauri]|uniref:DNA topoisomerase IV subunit A n=1 Tax=Mycoplasma tauri TaxID=547987 RepID=UPI001CBD083B|nr:DNA topoisomerase IV subunit A [Mycoplasma tauri]MBZ4226499.1 DNA topoisomerase IV subunit A [Mycoplasma tauri]